MDKSKSHTNFLTTQSVRVFTRAVSTRTFVSVGNLSTYGCGIIGAGVRYHVVIYNKNLSPVTKFPILGSFDYKINKLHMQFDDEAKRQWSILFQDQKSIGKFVCFLNATIAIIASQNTVSTDTLMIKREVPIRYTALFDTDDADSSDRDLDDDDADEGDDITKSSSKTSRTVIASTDSTISMYVSMWDLDRSKMRINPSVVLESKHMVELLPPNDPITLQVQHADRVIGTSSVGLQKALLGCEKGGKYLITLSPAMGNKSSWLLLYVEIVDILDVSRVSSQMPTVAAPDPALTVEAYVDSLVGVGGHTPYPNQYTKSSSDRVSMPYESRPNGGVSSGGLLANLHRTSKAMVAEMQHQHQQQIRQQAKHQQQQHQHQHHQKHHHHQQQQKLQQLQQQQLQQLQLHHQEKKEDCPVSNDSSTTKTNLGSVASIPLPLPLPPPRAPVSSAQYSSSQQHAQTENTQGDAQQSGTAEETDGRSGVGESRRGRGISRSWSSTHKVGQHLAGWKINEHLLSDSEGGDGDEDEVTGGNSGGNSVNDRNKDRKSSSHQTPHSPPQSAGTGSGLVSNLKKFAMSKRSHKT